MLNSALKVSGNNVKPYFGIGLVADDPRRKSGRPMERLLINEDLKHDDDSKGPGGILSDPKSKKEYLVIGQDKYFEPGKPAELTGVRIDRNDTISLTPEVIKSMDHTHRLFVNV